MGVSSPASERIAPATVERIAAEATAEGTGHRGPQSPIWATTTMPRAVDPPAVGPTQRSEPISGRCRRR